MQIYEVGGAIRDALLGQQLGDRDWVVVGATAEELLRLGYRQVGTDFPVFIHPETGEEYALARTERKTGPGYQGFTFDTRSEVTLEEDLMRRDLTINAIARDSNGTLIDPYGGQRDLAAKILRHVSPAFIEDPLRVLRVARFAARFAPLGFKIAPETLNLLQQTAESGELDALRVERIWLETEKALATERPDVFIEVLHDVGALKNIFPEIDRLFGVPQPQRWHPEIDTGVHLLMALRMAARLSPSLAMRFAVLTHDLGKGTTPVEFLPRHRGHEQRSVELIDTLCQRLPVPKKIRQTAELVAAHHGTVHRANNMAPGKLFDLVMRFDGLRKPERLEDILVACEADARGRLGLEEQAYPQAERIRAAAAIAGKIRIDALGDLSKLAGKEIGDRLHQAQREAVIENFRSDNSN